ncbi:MAG: sialidase family protein [Spirochaetota bacterium]
MKITNTILFRDRHRYAMGPSLVVAPGGGLVLAFNMTVMREVSADSPRAWLHPPYDPEYRNMLTRSMDGGLTWSAPQPFPGYGWQGMECPGLGVLANGHLLASVYRRTFHTESAAPEADDLVGALPRHPYPWVSSHGGTWVHRSTDGGSTWTGSVKVDTRPFISGYSHRGVVELPDGTLLLALAAADPFYDSYCREDLFWSGDPLGNERNPDGSMRVCKSRAFVALSRDGGHSWKETRVIAGDPGVNFFEPKLTRLRSGRLLCLLRSCVEAGDHLFQVVSDDDGLSWSEPVRTPIWGFPADIVELPDGRALAVYGYRRPPFGIRACPSGDGGGSWDIDSEIIIRDDLPNSNLGYPTAVVLEGGELFTVYWGEVDGVTCILGSRFTP